MNPSFIHTLQQSWKKKRKTRFTSAPQACEKLNTSHKTVRRLFRSLRLDLLIYRDPLFRNDNIKRFLQVYSRGFMYFSIIFKFFWNIKQKVQHLLSGHFSRIFQRIAKIPGFFQGYCHFSWFSRSSGSPVILYIRINYWHDTLRAHLYFTSCILGNGEMCPN